jgi:uncharacterized protein YkwD/uncharacterized membrane protein required for colicin V production
MPASPFDPSLLPPALHDLRAVDLVILAGLVLYGLDGVRRGFIAGALGLLGLFATVAVAVAAILPVSAMMRRIAPGVPLPDVAVRVLAFVVALAVAQVVFSAFSKVVLGLLRPLRRASGPLGLAERGLGFAPGVAQGLIVAALIITPLRLFPVFPPLSNALDDSVVAQEINHWAGQWSPQVEALLQGVAGDTAVPSRIVEEGENVSVPRTADVQADPESESRMLELVNAERVKAGLRPLVADERLRQLAREHSEEMFRLGYFSHVSPAGVSPGDRLKVAGITFDTAGENLAYAPTVEVAHAGLMASPGHRRNILTPEFTRIGIGVMRGGLYGRMFTQSFVG